MDGVAYGLEGSCHTLAELAPGGTARVTLATPASLGLPFDAAWPELVELWAPVAACERFWADKKKMRPCPEVGLNALSEADPLRIELLSADGSVLASLDVAAPAPVYSRS